MLRKFAHKSQRLFFGIFLFLAAAGSVRSQQVPANPKPGVIEVTTTLVEVDAVVSDKRGRAVTDLSVEDFQILQDGKPQPITAFSRIAAGSPLGSKPETGRPLGREDVRRTIAFVVDDFLFVDYKIETTRTLRQVRNTLTTFFDKSMRDGDLVALLSLAQRQGFEQFTNNREILKSLAAGLKVIPLMRLDSSTEDDEDRADDLRADKPVVDEAMADLVGAELEKLDRADRDDRVASLSLSALESVVAGMNGMPGRKSIVFFSKGIANANTLSRLINLANRAGVTFYTIDPREGEVTQFPKPPSSLSVLAKKTGGEVWGRNDADLNDRIVGAIEDQNSYYVLGYNPGAGSFDRRRHKIEVKVTRKDLDVHTSRTEFAGRPDIAEPESSKPADVLSRLLVSPFLKTDVHATLSTFFTAENGKSILNSLIWVDGRDLQAELKADGTYQGGADIMSVIVDPKGEFSGHVARSFRFKLDKQGWERAQQTGFVYKVPHDAEKPGPYQIRIALRDSVSGATGAASTFLTIPDVNNGDLTASNLFLSAPDTEQNPHPWSSPAARSFVKGHEIQWAVEIYNAKTATTKDGDRPQLQAALRIFRDGEKIYEGAFAPWGARTIDGRKDLAIRGLLGTGSLSPGEYALQVLVRDENAKRAQVSSVTDFRILP